MIISPDKKDQDLLGTLVEFAYAEYGSALEMLTAAKKATSPKLKLGYIRHALDEYRHTGLLFQVLSNQVKNGVGEFKREYKFSPQNVILKGYVDKEGFLVEKFPLKKFVEFVYSNEYLAKESFDYFFPRPVTASRSNLLQDLFLLAINPDRGIFVRLAGGHRYPGACLFAF